VKQATEKEPIAVDSESTHAVDIFAFVEAQQIPCLNLENSYYLVPAPGGEKVYALLRETLNRTRKIGIAYVVIQARQQMAALVPRGRCLMLSPLRWAGENDVVDRSVAAQASEATGFRERFILPEAEDREDDDLFESLEYSIHPPHSNTWRQRPAPQRQRDSRPRVRSRRTYS
jgi:hypothetical protein